MSTQDITRPMWLFIYSFIYLLFIYASTVEFCLFALFFPILLF